MADDGTTASSDHLPGRDVERRALLAALAAPEVRAVAVRGAAGIGKTRLVASALGALGDESVVVAAVASSGFSRIPFGAFSAALDAEGAGSDPAGGGSDLLEPPDMAWTLRHLRQALQQRRGERRLVVSVDDAHLLDEASASLVLQVARSGEACVLLTVRSGPSCPDGVSALLRDDGCRHLELHPLDRDAVAAIGTELLAGAWLDRTSLERLYAASGGNPLFVRELLVEALATGAVTVSDELATWHGPVRGTPRLATVVEHQLGRLAPDQQSAADLLAVGEPLPLALARRLVGGATLAALERAGVATTDADQGGMRLAHPLYGEVRRAQLGPAARAEIQRRLASAFDDAPERTPEDRLRVTRWRLDAGDAVGADDLRAGAELARRRGDEALALQLLEAADATAPSPSTTLELAELHHSAGRLAGAAVLLADDLTSRLATDQQRARAIAARIRLLIHEPAAARRASLDDDLALVEDPTWRAFVEAQWATTLAILDRRTEADAIIDRLQRHEDERVQIRLLPALNIRLLTGGRVEEALAAATACVPLALSHRDDVPIGTSLVFSALTVDLLQLGRVDEVDQILALTVGDPANETSAAAGYLRLVEGTVALRRGQLRDATRRLREAAAHQEVADPGGYRSLSFALLAEALAGGADPTAATAAARSAEVADGRADLLLDFERERALAWAPVGAGHVGAARTALLAAADRARSADQPLFEANALHDALRLGASKRVARRLVAAAARLDGPRFAAMRTHADAVVAQDPAGLEEATDRFEALGHLLLAADVATQAAEAFAAAGVGGAARRTATRAARLRGACPGAAHVGLATSARPSLTPRELQVARLAASGSSSRAISEELTVSVRTVDNALGRVYAKLGIRGRDELSPGLLDGSGGPLE